jgi:hypothetical protein
MDEVNENKGSFPGDDNMQVAVQDPSQEGPTPDQMRKRQEQALMFEKYLDESGLSLSFQIVFTEIIQK